MRPSIATALAALVLAGCGSGDVSLENASGAEVAAAAAKSGGGAAQMKPGQWEIVTESVEIDMPNLPPEARAMTEQMMGKGVVIKECRTAEQIRPDTSFLTGKKDGSCTFSRYEQSGGRIDADISCKRPGGGSDTTQKIAGTFGAEAFDVQVDMKSDEGDKGVMTIKAKVRGKRTGECVKA